MRFVLSGYGSDGIESLSIIDADLKNRFVDFLDNKLLTQPSYVISYDEDKTYVVTYTKNPLRLVSYYVDKKTSEYKLIEVDSIDVNYLSLTHLIYNKKEKCLFGCSYKDGMYLRVDLNKGYFSNLKTFENEKPSLCHCVIEMDNEIGIIDIKNDKINIYDYNLNYKKAYTLPRGVGPRHGLLYNDKIYVITEYSNELYVIDYKSGKILQNTTTLTYPVKSFGATLFIVDNKLYASNRGEESIAVFDIDDNGLVKLNHAFPCYGVHPRHMILTKDNKYIISVNKNSNTVTIIERETENCVLTFDYFEPSGIANI